MKKILLTFMIGFSILIARSQVLDNKINIHFGYESVMFLGKGLTKGDDFSTPSLYANYYRGNALLLNVLLKKDPFYSLGAGINCLRASGWEYPGCTDFKDSRINLICFSPVIQVHNKFRNSGIYNRVKAFAEISPSLGSSGLKLKYPLFEIRTGENQVSPPLSSHDLCYGIRLGAGLEFAVSHTSGLFIQYSVQRYWVKSRLYFDNHFMSAQFTVGFFARIRKNEILYF
jgi:hypothetical protein